MTFKTKYAPFFLVAVTIAAVGCARSPNNGAAVQPGAGAGKPGAGGAGANTPSAPATETRVDAQAIVENQNLTPDQKAEELAKAAEQLLSAQGFAYADKVADLALQADPKNFRARFIKALLKPLLVQRGLVARLAPIAGKDARLKDKYDRLMVKIDQKLPVSTLRTFLQTGPADITSENELQAHLDQTAEAFKQLREFLKANKDNTLTMSVSDVLAEPLMRRLRRACNISETAPLSFDLSCPAGDTKLEVTLNRADFEALQHAAAGAEIGLSIGNSYDLAGTIAVAQAHANDDLETLDPQELVQEALKQAKFATLRNNQGFQRLKDMGAEAVAGVRWILDNKDQSCPQGSADTANRLGSILDADMCSGLSTSTAQDVLAKVETSVGGGTIKFGQAELKPLAWMTSPIADLRTQAPTIDECGQVVTWKDQTWGGILASSNADALFPKKDCNK